MDYEKFEKILNKYIFANSKRDLLSKIALYPHRYIGLFRPTTAKAKLFQNLLHTHEIRFDDAFEKIITSYLEENNFTICKNSFKYFDDSVLNVDIFFKKENTYYFVEQKIRDDHDSTKKRGQIDNFEKKLEIITLKIKPNKKTNLVGFFYFVDPDLKKNQNYYFEKLQSLSNEYGVPLHLCYGKEFFDKLKINYVWEEIISHLTRWKKTLKDIPEINFDLDAEKTFNEIKDLPPSIFKKLFQNEKIYNEILLILFPEKKVLRKLLSYFEQQNAKIYDTLKTMLIERLD